METKRNLKYYIAPPISIVTIVGLAIMVVAVIFLFFPATRMYAILGLIAGLGVIIFSSGGKASDTDIEYQARARMKDLQENSMKKNEVYEKNFLKMMKPLDLAGYDFEAPETPLYYKKGRDGTPRTNFFAGYNLIFSGEYVYIHGRRLCLTDESIDEESNASYKYTELDHAEVLAREFTHNDEKIEYHVFRIITTEGTEALKACVDYGADTDKAVEDINRAIKVRCEELEKRSEERKQKLDEFRAKVKAEADAIEAERKKNEQ